MNSITAKKYNKSITENIYSIGRRLDVRDSDFKNIETIPRARVPVIKGIYNHCTTGVINNQGGGGGDEFVIIDIDIVRNDP